MKTVDDIINYLQMDPVRNVNILNFINDYPIYYIEKVENSVIAKGTSDRDWTYISSESEEDLQNIKEKLGKDDNCFAVIEDWMIPIITKDRRIKWQLSTRRLFLPESIDLLDTQHTVSDLRIEDGKFIYENSDYKEYLSIEYIRERIERGLSSAIYGLDGLVAWGITQDDGAIGFLHVLPEYRSRGYARDITLDLIKKIRKQGKLPFVHIEDKNDKSMGLALSIGFKKDRVINWFEIE